jgi:hypothetical protein
VLLNMSRNQLVNIDDPPARPISTAIIICLLLILDALAHDIHELEGGFPAAPRDVRTLDRAVIAHQSHVLWVMREHATCL